MKSPRPGLADHLSDLYFADLDLPPAVRAGIAACGFVRATPVQAMSLPFLLAGRDVAVQAQTGTGKTAAYLISILTRLARKPRVPGRGEAGAPRALAVAPTRELAVQIRDDAMGLSHFLKPRIVTVFGGLDYNKQREQLRAGCDILIGTPGRLLDYEQQGATSFGSVESLVIDEADRLFDLGFIRDLRRILRHCPPPGRRHSMMFSATLSYRVMELAYEHMNDAERIEVQPERVTAAGVTETVYHVAGREKLSLLLGIVEREGLGREGSGARTMLFVNTKRFADRLATELERHGHHVGTLTGDIPQAKRLRILSDFKLGRIPFLIATDVASRGLHIEAVTHVINVDLPQDAEDYVHRIGRTARAGKTGKAISLACEDYVFSLAAIEKLIGHKVPVEFAEDSLYRSRHPAPKPPPVTSGGPRHLAPVEAGPWAPAAAAAVVEEEEDADEEPEAVPAPASAQEKDPEGEGAIAGVIAGEPAFVDFWSREALGLTTSSVGVMSSASAPSPAKRKKRRRGRRPATA